MAPEGLAGVDEVLEERAAGGERDGRHDHCAGGWLLLGWGWCGLCWGGHCAWMLLMLVVGCRLVGLGGVDEAVVGVIG